ncbi:MAG: response regulator, partial [Gammaproteobacteria bacterium]
MMVKRIESANILIVEDEPYDAEHLSLHLQQAGHRVAGVVATGEDALLRVAQGGIDLMVVDIVLPGKIDGIETAMQ